VHGREREDRAGGIGEGSSGELGGLVEEGDAPFRVNLAAAESKKKEIVPSDSVGGRKSRRKKKKKVGGAGEKGVEKETSRKERERNRKKIQRTAMRLRLSPGKGEKERNETMGRGSRRKPMIGEAKLSKG